MWISELFACLSCVSQLAEVLTRGQGRRVLFAFTVSAFWGVTNYVEFSPPTKLLALRFISPPQRRDRAPAGEKTPPSTGPAREDASQLLVPSKGGAPAGASPKKPPVYGPETPPASKLFCFTWSPLRQQTQEMALWRFVRAELRKVCNAHLFFTHKKSPTTSAVVLRRRAGASPSSPQQGEGAGRARRAEQVVDPGPQQVAVAALERMYAAAVIDTSAGSLEILRKKYGSLEGMQREIRTGRDEESYQDIVELPLNTTKIGILETKHQNGKGLWPALQWMFQHFYLFDRFGYWLLPELDHLLLSRDRVFAAVRDTIRDWVRKYIASRKSLASTNATVQGEHALLETTFLERDVNPFVQPVQLSLGNLFVWTQAALACMKDHWSDWGQLTQDLNKPIYHGCPRMSRESGSWPNCAQDIVFQLQMGPRMLKQCKRRSSSEVDNFEKEGKWPVAGDGAGSPSNYTTSGTTTASFSFTIGSRERERTEMMTIHPANTACGGSKYCAQLPELDGICLDFADKFSSAVYTTSTPDKNSKRAEKATTTKIFRENTKEHPLVRLSASIVSTCDAFLMKFDEVAKNALAYGADMWVLPRSSSKYWRMRKLFYVAANRTSTAAARMFGPNWLQKARLPMEKQSKERFIMTVGKNVDLSRKKQTAKRFYAELFSPEQGYNMFPITEDDLFQTWGQMSAETAVLHNMKCPEYHGIGVLAVQPILFGKSNLGG
ncbi:unnamed protein product [Amoebophrya sp. A120]|nr:unnamed protein product [Amoebophrya sp. A120]|eukprot:GSA120T00025214001.1